MKRTQFVSVLVMILTAFAVTLTTAHAAADFTVAASPTSFFTLYAGSGVNDTITITSTGGFTGTVTLSGSATTGISLAFNPTSVTLSSGGQATSTLTITADPNCNVGNGHSIRVTGTSGTLSHNAFITWQIVTC